MSISLYKVSQSFIQFYRLAGVTNTTAPNSPYVPQANSTQVLTWLMPYGELLFFMKPSDYLQVVVTTDKAIYCPGDLVNY